MHRSKEHKNLILIKTYYCLCAAHNLDMTQMYSELVSNNQTIESAQKTADMCNMIYANGEARAIDFMKPNSYYVDNSLDFFNAYKDYLDKCPLNKNRLVKSFAHWYANSKEAVVFKTQIQSIIQIGKLYLTRHMHQQEGFNVKDILECWKSPEMGVFQLKEMKIKRLYVYAMSKVQELDSKIEARTASLTVKTQI